MDPATRQTPVEIREAALAKFAELSFGREVQLEEMLERFEVIARIVGHDFGLSVSYGQPFSGYFFTPTPPHVVIDPARALIDPREAEFAVEHEGAHRYNTYSLLHPDFEAMLGQMFPVRQLAQSVGFNAVFNGIEDPTINRWLLNVYPGSREKMVEVYDRQFAGKEAKLYTPEVQLCELLLGFYPKFGQFLSATIRKWHTGSWGEVLDPQVAKALEDTSDAVQRIIPLTVEQTGAPEVDRKIACMKRYVHYISSVWPIVRKLVADDIEEAGYQAFRQAVQNSPGFPDQKSQPQPSKDPSQNGEESGGSTEASVQSGQPQEDGDQTEHSKSGADQKEGDGQPQEGNVSDGAGQEDPNGRPSPGGAGDPADTPPDDAPQTGAGEGAVDDLINNLPEGIRDELRELLKTLKGAKDSPPLEPGSENSADSSDAGDPSAGEEPGDSPAPDGEPSSEVGQPSDEPGKESDSPGAEGDGHETQPSPLTPAEDKALREFFRKLFPRQRGGFEERGLFNLKNFEDAINRHLRSNLDPFQVPTHQELEEMKEAARQAEERRASDFKAAERLEVYRQSLLTPWDKSLEQRGEDLLRLVNSMRRTLKPISPERTGGYRSGVGLSLPHLMQDQARQIPTHRVFEQISLPQSRSYFFQVLADRSDSMNESNKKHYNLTGVVLASEAFQRIGVPFELATFDSSFLLLKERNARFTKEEKEEAARAILHCSGGTADYVAIDKMRQRAHASGARYKVMFVTTDGASNNSTLLRRAIRQTSDEGIFLVGLGLGGDTASVNFNYPNGRGLLNFGGPQDSNSFVNYFLAMINDIITDPGKFRLSKS